MRPFSHVWCGLWIWLRHIFSHFLAFRDWMAFAFWISVVGVDCTPWLQSCEGPQWWVWTWMKRPWKPGHIGRNHLGHLLSFIYHHWHLNHLKHFPTCCVWSPSTQPEFGGKKHYLVCGLDMFGPFSIFFGGDDRPQAFWFTNMSHITCQNISEMGWKHQVIPHNSTFFSAVSLSLCFVNCSDFTEISAFHGRHGPWYGHPFKLASVGVAQISKHVQSNSTMWGTCGGYLSFWGSQAWQDCEPQEFASKEATRLLRSAAEWLPPGAVWEVEHLDILDDSSTSRFWGSFDVVYSYGVLHHTGAMYEAVQKAFGLLRPKTGVFYLALYPIEGASNSRVEEHKNRVLEYRKTQSRERHLVFEAEVAYCNLMPTIAAGGLQSSQTLHICFASAVSQGKNDQECSSVSIL